MAQMKNETLVEFCLKKWVIAF